MTNIQFYAEGVEAEAEGVDTILVTLTKIDLSELNGQVTLDDLLEGWDVADIHTWVQEKLKDE